MRNSFIIFFLSFFLTSYSLAENIFIEAKNISLDKNKETTIFEKDVVVKTDTGDVIKSEFAEYNRVSGFIKLRKKVIAIDSQSNQIETDYAEYNDKTKIFKTVGLTKIITSSQYIVNTEDLLIDKEKKSISSKSNTIITDTENNKILLDNFEYLTHTNIFKSVGSIKIVDKIDNSYEFSQIYIDTKKKEIIGSDTKAYLNSKDFKIDQKNKPRIFSNTVAIGKKYSSFEKSVFTLCDYRENDKCPPWSIQSSKMLHDNKKKTIYYDHAVIKIYDIPIFYIPKLSHPDPTVDRRSGFLPPSFSDTRNLGTGISLPYFFALNNDKNFTLTNNFFDKEHPLFLGEYHQALLNGSFLADVGYTEGYKRSSPSKPTGSKSHFFSKFSKNFINDNGVEKSFNLVVQDVSNDKYLKLYKINSDLIDHNISSLENSIKYTHEEDDLFFGFNANIYETLNDDYNDKYEYIFPEMIVDKNLYSDENYGNLDLQSNYKVHKYDTNKFTNFFVNDLNWNFRDIDFKSGLKSKILGNIKNINYETKNVDIYKKDTTSELYGAIGFLTELDLIKSSSKSNHLLTPKFLVRYSPGAMRKETDGFRLDPLNAFSLNRLNNVNNFETGLSGTIGLDYKIKSNGNDFDFSLAQVINEEENKKMASKSSLDEKLSDLVGSAKYKLNDNFSLNYNFSADQNYKEFNYNEFGATINFNSLNFDFNYLHEDKHIGNKEYLKTKVNFKNNDDGVLSFQTKRNLITNSAEFYNLSYEYLNDCLRAGLVYRREFYTDSEIEPENSLMFKITLTPFGNISSPSFNQ